jgi:hypothetical protein
MESCRTFYECLILEIESDGEEEHFAAEIRFHIKNWKLTDVKRRALNNHEVILTLCKQKNAHVVLLHAGFSRG